MHDVLDIIRNVQSLYAIGPTLGILKDYERVMDELDLYVFENWHEGELLEGPKDSRHFVTCSFMWPQDKMPDPLGGRLQGIFQKRRTSQTKTDQVTGRLQTRNNQRQNRCTSNMDC